MQTIYCYASGHAPTMDNGRGKWRLVWKISKICEFVNKWILVIRSRRAIHLLGFIFCRNSEKFEKFRWESWKNNRFITIKRIRRFGSIITLICCWLVVHFVRFFSIITNTRKVYVYSSRNNSHIIKLTSYSYYCQIVVELWIRWICLFSVDSSSRACVFPRSIRF